MKNSNSFGVHYILRHADSKTGKSTIYARITVNSDRTEMALKCEISKNDWNSIKGAAKPKNEDLNALNFYLDEVRAKCHSHYKALELKEQPITADIIKALFLGLDGDNEKKTMTLCKALEMHYKGNSAILAWGTLKNYKTTLSYVRQYCATKNQSADVHLRQLNYAFIENMATFIPAHPIKKNKPCNRNGLMKHIERLKKISNWCVMMGWIEKDPFLAYKLKFTHKDPIFLEYEELNRIESFEFQDPHIQYVADLFIFSCYTGLDYGDLLDLNPDNIGKDNHGNTWIYTNRNKTEIRVVVPMLTPAVAIKNKYSLALPGVAQEKLFPWISNQEVNRCLKLIAMVLGITKRLIFKTARHTFATTVTLLNGVPIETVSKMLGHTKLSTTMIYTHITHAKIAIDMQQLQDKITSRKKLPAKVVAIAS